MCRVDRRMHRILRVGAVGVLVALLASSFVVWVAPLSPPAGAQPVGGVGETHVVFSCPTGTTTVGVGATAEPSDLADGGTLALILTAQLRPTPVVGPGGDVWLSYPLPPAVDSVGTVAFTGTGGGGRHRVVHRRRQPDAGPFARRRTGRVVVHGGGDGPDAIGHRAHDRGVHGS